MEMKKPRFNLEMRKNEINDKFFILIMDKELEDYMGWPIICQKCNKTIGEKFFVCEEYFKWFCSDCQLNVNEELNWSEIDRWGLCKNDRKRYGKRGETHNHICIQRIERDEHSGK